MEQQPISIEFHGRHMNSLPACEVTFSAAGQRVTFGEKTCTFWRAKRRRKSG
jgi:hypothetical protein